MDARNPADATTVIVPAGVLGSGLRPEHVDPAVDAGAHAIAIDAGSTDSGPAYLARGMAKFNREAIRKDLDLLITASARARIPLLVGSCGTCGCDSSVHEVSDIVQEIARARGLAPRIAMLLSEQQPEQLKRYIRHGRVTPLAPAGPLDDGTLDACDHIVALMGAEPYAAALRQGADIVLGGRTTDTAIIAAVPLMRGAGAGPAWHAGKVAECGGLAAVNPRDGGVLVRVGPDAFTMEPLSPGNRCTVNSVSAHMLYENSDPFRLTEPGGVLDVQGAGYVQLDARTVRVTGSRFEPRPYTMKLEGAGSGPFQTIMLIGIQDPAVLAEVDAFHDRMQEQLWRRVVATFGDEAACCDISLRIYGWNARLRPAGARRHGPPAGGRGACSSPPPRPSPASSYAVRGNGEKAWLGWPSSEPLEAMHDEWFGTTGAADRVALARRMQHQVLTGPPSIPLGQILLPTAFRRNLTGIVEGFPKFYGVRCT